MHSLRRLCAVVVLSVVVMAIPAQAFGAPVKLDDTMLYVQFWPEGEAQTNVVIVGVELDQAVKLPATVQLPLPKGATVFWAGEISGSDAAADIERNFKLVDGPDGKLVEFTAETTRAIQYDATVGAVEMDGNDILTSLDWNQAVKSKAVSFAVRVPSGVENVRISPDAPGEPQSNAAGEKLYTLPDMALQPGDTTKVEVVYNRMGLDSESSSTPGLLPILFGLLAAAVVALIAAVALQRRKTSSPE